MLLQVDKEFVETGRCVCFYIYTEEIEQQMQEKKQYERTNLMSLYGLDGDRSYPTIDPAELTSWLG